MPPFPLVYKTGSAWQGVMRSNTGGFTLSHGVLRELTAILPYPPGVNRIWRIGRGRGGTPVSRIYKTAEAAKWDEDAAFLLRAVGWRPLPEGRYWVYLTCILSISRHDIDTWLGGMVRARQYGAAQ